MPEHSGDLCSHRLSSSSNLCVALMWLIRALIALISGFHAADSLWLLLPRKSLWNPLYQAIYDTNYGDFACTEHSEKANGLPSLQVPYTHNSKIPLLRFRS